MAKLIEDDELRFLMLGWLGAAVQMPHFPVDVREVERIDDAAGQGEAFRLITRSGLTFRVDMTFEGKRA